MVRTIFIIFFIFITIWWTKVNVNKFISQNRIPWVNFFIQVIVTGVVTYFLNIW